MRRVRATVGLATSRYPASPRLFPITLAVLNLYILPLKEALTQVTSIDGLFICNRYDDLKCYHGRIIPKVLRLQEEF